MPRLARLDAPGVLHQIIIRGIERRTIEIRPSQSRDRRRWATKPLNHNSKEQRKEQKMNKIMNKLQQMKLKKLKMNYGIN